MHRNYVAHLTALISIPNYLSQLRKSLHPTKFLTPYFLIKTSFIKVYQENYIIDQSYLFLRLTPFFLRSSLLFLALFSTPNNEPIPPVLYVPLNHLTRNLSLIYRLGRPLLAPNP